MGENGIPMEYQNGGGDSRYENGEMLNGVTNGEHKHHSSKHKHKDKSHDKERRKETEEERRIRKEKEREEREKRYQKEGKRMETEEERKIRKEKERRDRDERHKKEGRRIETEEERAIRKEKEKREGRRQETEEERAARKEKERREREERHAREGRREETEEERRIRKEKERRDRDDKHRSKDRDHSRGHKETEEERKVRKERERRERKQREAEHQRIAIKEEDTEIKTEPEDSQDNDTAGSAYEEDADMHTDVKEEPESEEEYSLANGKHKAKGNKRKHKIETKSDESNSKQISEDQYKKVKLEVKDLENGNSMKHNDMIKKEDTMVEEEKTQKIKTEVKKESDNNPKQESKRKCKNSDKIKEEKPEIQTNEKQVKKEKKVKEEEIVCKWWEEEHTNDGVRWKFLEHKGPLFPPEYEPLPSHVRFFYDNKPMKLSVATEEVACFYGKMIEHDYTTKEVFNKNFFKDWRKKMTDEEREIIRDLKKCGFSEINDHFKTLSEERKARPKEEKKAEKLKNELVVKEYGFCNLDGYQQRIGNFRLEPPGLFRGRGEHPKQGKLKYRLKPEDITINCSADSVIPKPPEGHNWKEVVHKNDVTWLAMWNENVQNQFKYIMLNATSKFKGQNDMKKYDKARELKGNVEKIRKSYTADFKSNEMRIRQRAVAMYFIDKLALRAGNEKDENEEADTVGCCSLRVEHVKLYEKKDGKENVVAFDFLGKDSIRYLNEVPVEKRVFKNVKIFMDNKKPDDDLFDRLTTDVLNKHLKSFMPGLTAKVFRTYNASITLQEQLEKLTKEDDNIAQKILAYNRANREVAILCNHQRAIPKGHEKSMDILKQKIDSKKEAITEAEKEYNAIKKQNKGKESADVEKKKKAVGRLKEQLSKLEIQQIDKDENKTIALGTSKLNYLDPRISIAWCRKFDVPIEKIYAKTQRDKFQWAIDMTTADYIF